MKHVQGEAQSCKGQKRRAAKKDKSRIDLDRGKGGGILITGEGLCRFGGKSSLSGIGSAHLKNALPGRLSGGLAKYRKDKLYRWRAERL